MSRLSLFVVGLEVEFAKLLAHGQCFLLNEPQVVGVAVVGDDAVGASDDDSGSVTTLVEDLAVGPWALNQHYIAELLTMVLIDLELECPVAVCSYGVVVYHLRS